MKPEESDSLSRMLLCLGRLSPDPVYFGRKQITSPPSRGVVIGESFFRRFSCDLSCRGACCSIQPSLDYMRDTDIIPAYRDLLRKRVVSVNGKEFEVWSMQGDEGVTDVYCRFFRRDTGLCELWDSSSERYRPPIECLRSPQIQVIVHRLGYSMLLKKPFGRAWRYPRPPACRFERVLHPVDLGIADDVDRLERLLEWANFFGVRTALPEIIDHLRAVRLGDAPPGRWIVRSSLFPESA